MGTKRAKSGRLRRGCLGCLLPLVVIGLLLSVTGFFVIRSNSRPGRIATVEERHPPAEASLPVPGAGETTPARGLIRLEIREAVVKIERGAAGEGVVLSAEYDSDRFELIESHADGSPWSYSLKFRRTKGRGWFGMSWPHNRIRLRLPPDGPLDLTGSLARVESELQLGGLWLVDVDLEMDAGEHEVDFHEPLVVPMEQFELRASGVELAVIGVGNASPRRFDVRQNLGDFDLDLRGAWRRDATVRATCTAGEIDAKLPENVQVELLGDDEWMRDPQGNLLSGAAILGNPETIDPVLQIDLDASVCRVRRRLR